MIRYIGKFEENIGFWWYDFSVDCFETTDYVGAGEIWFITGEKNTIAFSDQTCIKLHMDNGNRTIAAVWKVETELKFECVSE